MSKPDWLQTHMLFCILGTVSIVYSIPIVYEFRNRLYRIILEISTILRGSHVHDTFETTAEGKGVFKTYTSRNGIDGELGIGQ